MNDKRDTNPTTASQTIRELATNTATILGYQISPEDPERTNIAELHGPDEIKLFWLSPWRPKDRVEISGRFPEWHDAYETGTYHPRERLSITIAKSSSPEHAAREVQRRLLPGYLAQLEEAKAMRAAWRQRNAEQHRTMTMLETLGARRVARKKDQMEIGLSANDEGRFRHGDLRISHYDNSVDIDFRNLSPEQAAAVLRALVERRDM